MDARAAGELLCSLLYHDSSAGPTAWRELSIQDWQSVVQQAKRHRVTGLLYSQLKDAELRSHLPNGVIETLRMGYLVGSGTNMRLYHHAGRVLGALHDAGVQVIALKGAHLGPIVYGNRALREMEDLDLLARRQDLDRVAQVLVDLGYVAEQPYWLDAELENHCHLPRFTLGDTPEIEVHWDLLHPRLGVCVDVPGLWRRARPASIAGVEALVMCPEDLLNHLALHAALQHWFEVSIKSLCDVVEVVRHTGKELDWELAGEIAARWGSTRSFYLMLALTHDLLRLELSAQVRQSVERAGVDATTLRWAKEQVLGPRVSSRTPSPQVVSVWAMRRPLDKVRALLRIAFPTRRFLATKYPVAPSSPRIWRCYLAHWRDLVQRYAAPWSGRPRGEQTSAQEMQRDRVAALRKWLFSG